MNHWQKWLMAALGGVALAAALTLVAAGDSPEREDPALAQGTIYVDVDATGADDGSSWEDAYTALQPALDEAVAGDEIWVAAGTYKPTYESVPGNPRSATFQLKNGVALYGGFDPSVGDIGFEDRDWAANATILSGDLNGDDVPPFGNSGENSYHVFYHPQVLGLDGTAVLDGFTLTGGHANGGYPHNDGGGMRNMGASPTVTNCTFSGNWASHAGGGMCNSYSSSPQVTNCTFSGNWAAQYGGGMYNDNSSPAVTGCSFWGNISENWGGGMYNYNHSSPKVTNCTFSANTAMLGGGMCNQNSTPEAINCILWGDDSPDEIHNFSSSPSVTYSDIQGGYAGTGNIDLDPFLEAPAIGDVDLLSDSPCIDAGTNGAPNLPPYDFEGDPRIWDGDFDGTATADMGADEFSFHALALHLAGNGSGTVEQTPQGARLVHGTVVALTATADTGSSFTGWSGDAGGTTNPITLTMDADKVVMATFVSHRVYLPLVVRNAP